MACADFLCLPSLREGLNITVLEAGAMGLPTIGAPINGLKDIIQHGTTGYLVDDRSPQAWAKAIETLARDENLREQLGTNAMAWVKREFDKPTIEKRYLDYFNACLKGPPRRV
jgi:glycosyltransferase involved in cell wall biosynthesis